LYQETSSTTDEHNSVETAGVNSHTTVAGALISEGKYDICVL